MNSLLDIRIFLGLVPKESPCTIIYNQIQYKIKHTLKLCCVQTSIFLFFLILNVYTTHQTSDTKTFLARRKIEYRCLDTN
jgi:hypothetical protein